MIEPAEGQGTRYTIDARGSRLTIHAYASGLLSAVGHDPVIAVRELSGEVRFAPDSPDAAAVLLKMSTASLVVQNDVSDKDRREIERTMNDDVLESAKYPEIAFAASHPRIDTVNEGRYRVEADGQLTLHGADAGTSGCRRNSSSWATPCGRRVKWPCARPTSASSWSQWPEEL